MMVVVDRAWGGPPTGKLFHACEFSVIVRSRNSSFYRGLRSLVVALVPVLWPAVASAQWSRTYDSYYLPASHNWVFRRLYPEADRLFNAFDYGHAILYEQLWTKPKDDPRLLEEEEHRYLTTKLLKKPPRLPLEEMAIEPNYARLAPEAKAMFEWAHLLHRQAYDILASPAMSWNERDRAMEQLVRHYQRRRDLAFSDRPKNMSLMQEQPYSLAFRQRYPKFNGLIWAYHWLQIGLYEPLMLSSDTAQRRAAVRATVGRFWQMVEAPDNATPFVMPMTPTVAPRFAKRYPTLGIIFDNLHSLHDVISDILANPAVPRDAKRREILLAALRYRDDTTDVMTPAGWVRMSEMMGIANQGGPAVGFGAALPTPTVARGFVMRHDANGNMLGGEHAGHEAPVKDEHAGHDMSAMGSRSDTTEILGAIDDFHKALAAGDSLSALALLDEEVDIVEGARRESKTEYRAGHLRGDIAYAQATQRERQSVQVRIGGAIAWVVSVSRVRGTVNGRAVDRRTGETMILERRGGAWRIVSIHWS